MTASLQGKTILVTREKKQAREFAEKIKARGGKPIVVPLLQISCKLDIDQQFLQKIESYSWLFFTSANGVHAFVQLVKVRGIRLQDLSHIPIAAVGEKTARILKTYGFHTTFMPSTFNGATMVEEFLEQYDVSSSILLIRGNLSRDTIPEEFKAKGIPFETVELYATTTNYEVKEQLNTSCYNDEIDFLTFTSPSTVQAFMELKEEDDKLNQLIHTPCVCIGTTTADKAEQLGFTHIIVPSTFTIDGMIQQMEHYIGKGE
ncbi:uroporphyrinogen-III synthase [Oceanobacillus halotolerans]|uniref:uroporphyrinogen-III synthase n=1 Tax=Oceanobacillus halotolerans TaxID=2663380 RepID=UPI0013DA9153|nr:uroporphyrinogen-III synthase [Oceanobacillus halotolerans]